MARKKKGGPPPSEREGRSEGAGRTGATRSGGTPVTPLPPRFQASRLWLLLGMVALLALAALLTVVRPWGDRGASDSATLEPLPPPTVRLAAASITNDDFVGSDACASCHANEYDVWRRSTHGTAGGAPSATTVIAPFDGTPIRFKDALVIPTSAGGYRFIVRQQGRAERVFAVDGVIGRGHMAGGGTQGFVSKFPDGTWRFLPFDFHRIEGRWFCNTEARAGKGWQPITPEMVLADCGDWPPIRVLGDEVRYTNCQSCHGSQIVVSLDSAQARQRTRLSTLQINCESCHGPGRRHVALVKDARAVAAGDVGMTALATLSKDGSLGTCWSCHALKDRLRGGFIAGERLEDFYALRTPQLGDRAHLADGRVRTFAYQQGHLWSDCYVNGGMTCTSCHDPHSQGYRTVDGTPIPGRFDDRQCTSCHQAKAAAPTLHTHHAANSEGSRCVGCHMPYLQEPEVGMRLRYARSDHAIPVPRPAADSAAGVTSACKTCHADKGEGALDQQVRAWYGELKPVAPGIAAVQRAATLTDRAQAARLVLNPRETHTAALFTGMAQFAESFLSADMADIERDVTDRLDQLAAHPDLDVRALALGSLHLAAGNRGAVRGKLAAHLRSLGADEPRVRARWALVLGFFADRARTDGRNEEAIRTYRKALEIAPDDPRIHHNLGVAQSQGGAFADAAASIRQSLALDPQQPLALVNLGIALASAGDKGGAEAAYRRALALNAHEPLAWFNLANIYYEQQKLDEAQRGYEQAVASDPSLPVAHFYLARLLAARGELARALQETNAGLEFAPGNAEALAARETIQRAMAERGLTGGAGPGGR